VAARGCQNSQPITLPVIIAIVIASFRDRGSADVFDGYDSRAARGACPRTVWPVARRKLDQLNRVRELRELAVPPGNRLERLKSDRSGQHSIRINDQYRICFRWENGDAYAVEITDYH
jgi:proteic killer suppression protein